MIDYNIISTGSKGNAVMINLSILIDCGVPFKALRDYYKQIQLVLLTHIHEDHFNKPTIRKLAKERPALRWGVPVWLAGDIVKCGVDKRNIDVYGMDTEYIYQNFSITPFPLFHNVENCGYKIYIGDYHNPEKLLYATDTNSMTGIEAKNYDLYMLEANYNELEIKNRIEEKQTNGAYCHEYEVLQNHLSREKADDWLYQNIGANSRYIYMHGHCN